MSPNPNNYHRATRDDNGNHVISENLNSLSDMVNGLRNLAKFQTASLAHCSEQIAETAHEQMDVIDFEDECSICLCSYRPIQQVQHLSCEHKFHSKCIEKWLSSENTCPLCRRRIVSRSVRYEPIQPSRDTESSAVGQDAATEERLSESETESGSTHVDSTDGPITRARTAAIAQQINDDQMAFRRITRQISQRLRLNSQSSNDCNT